MPRNSKFFLYDDLPFKIAIGGTPSFTDLASAINRTGRDTPSKQAVSERMNEAYARRGN